MIVIISSEVNADAPRIAAMIVARGHDAVVFNTDELPSASRLVVDPLSLSRSSLVSADGTSVSLEEVNAAWLWKFGELTIPDHLSPRHAALISDNFGLVTHSVVRMLESSAFVLCALDPVRRASDKLLQLGVAADLGFRIPATRVTNSAETAAAFVQEHGSVVFKMLVSQPGVDRGDRTRDPDIRSDHVFTRLLRPEDTERLPELQLCPGILQAFVAKTLDVRVIVVGQRLFCAEIHSQVDERTAVDYRQQWQHGIQLETMPHELPPQVAQRCLDLARTLELDYCAIDLVVTPDGEHVFLEVNPTGLFAWVQAVTRMPIAEAIADLLCMRARGSLRPVEAAAGSTR